MRGRRLAGVSGLAKGHVKGLVIRLVIGLTAWASAHPAAHAAGPSAFGMMSPELQAMQRDDSLNPGMLWVLDGQARWARSEGPAGKSCADCHGATPAERLGGVAARYPAWDAATSRPLNLGERIAACRSRHQGLRQAADTEALLALEAAVAHVSRGQAVSPAADPRLQPWRDRGQALWQQRMGQLDLSCAQCHDERVGRRLGGSLIPPGHGAGYPTYRLEWQALGSLQRRIRNCNTGVRAEPWRPGSDEVRALEVFIASRDRGLAVEAPAVRP
ncbi:MAG: sulfur oxidation c-type cytochrome SoxA [Betaproteobacteria bacterium]